MDLESIMLSEISQSEKDKYHMISLVCMWNLIYKINKQSRSRLIDTENRLTAVRGKWGWWGWVKKVKGLP